MKNESALDHARSLSRKSLKVFFVAFPVALASLWLAISGYGEFWGKIALILVLIGAAAVITMFLSNIRVWQLLRDDA